MRCVARPRGAPSLAGRGRWRLVAAWHGRSRCRRPLLDGGRATPALVLPGPQRTPRSARPARRTAARRQWVPLAEIDPDLIAAFVAAEDRRFYQPPRRRSARGRRGRAWPTSAPAASCRAPRRSRCSSRGCSGPRRGPGPARRRRRCGRSGSSAPRQAGDPGAVPQPRAAGPGRDRASTPRARSTSAPRRGAEPRAGGAARRARACAVERQSAGLAPAAPKARRAIVLAAPAARWATRPREAARARARSRAGARRRRAGRRSSRRTSPPACSLERAGRRRRPGRLAHLARSVAAGGARGRGRGTRSRRCATGRPRMPRRSCSTTRAARSSPGSARPTSGPETAGQVDMVVSPRQPGSALKPFLYGARLRPRLHRRDDPARYRDGVPDRRPDRIAPRNYDRRFHGPVRAREALGSSYNVPAVELAERLGVGEPARRAAPRRIRLARRTRSTTGSASRSATATSPCWSWPTATVRWRTAACGGRTLAFDAARAAVVAAG